ncbi:unnamed protein product, partial [Polarella glacialis]
PNVRAAAGGRLRSLPLLCLLGVVFSRQLLFSSSWQAFASGREAPGGRRLRVAAAAGNEPTTLADQRYLQEAAARDRVQIGNIEKVQTKGKEPQPDDKPVLGKFWVNQPGMIAFEVQWNEGDKVSDIRAVIEKVTDIPPDKQELKLGRYEIGPDGQLLEALDLEDVWLIDDRDEGERRGEYNPDPEDDTSTLASPGKVFFWVVIGILTLFWATQVAGVNPYANFPEGPRQDWSKVPYDLRPGNEPNQAGFFQTDPSKRVQLQGFAQPKSDRDQMALSTDGSERLLKSGF